MQGQGQYVDHDEECLLGKDRSDHSIPEIAKDYDENQFQTFWCQWQQICRVLTLLAKSIFKIYRVYNLNDIKLEI